MRFKPSLVLLSLPWLTECADDRKEIRPRKDTEAFDGSYYGFIPSVVGPKLHNSLRTLHLHRGEVSGSLPTEIGMLTLLTGIVVLENNMEGTLPTEIGGLTQMFDSFELRGNRFSGEIPYEFGFLTGLTGSFILNQEVDDEATLGGTIPPELSELTQLQKSFVLHGLHSSGSLPSELFALSLLTEQFQISNNGELGGTLPTEVGLISGAKELLLNGNQFTGPIPTEVGTLTNLEHGLVLSQNAFTGTVPTQFGRLSQLKMHFDLGDNSLMGQLPTQLGNLEKLEYGFILRGNAYLDTVAIPTEVASLSSSMHERIEKIGLYDDGHAFAIEDPVERFHRRELLAAPTSAPTVVQETPEEGDRVQHQIDVVDLSAWQRCPNECSGHGLCRDPGICECYRRANDDFAWTLNDCSLRTCPKGAAWWAVATAANEAHPYTECSNAGTCNRKTGECNCFGNYEGIACERTRCPNDCSHRGICYTQKQLAKEASMTYTSPWDAMKVTGCVCDVGFRGPDCSLMECPNGPDLMKGDGNEKGRDCSGRGICDYGSGLCKCFSGYYGAKCQFRTILE
jgi:hypothetical protein